jgi:hypothetical protein
MSGANAWEYTLTINDGDDYQGRLNDLGAQGWEAVGFDATRHLLLKRGVTIAGPPAVTDTPMISGPSGISTAAVGDTLSCTMGNWTEDPYEYAFQWQQDGVDIPYTTSTYVVLAGDSGHSLTCVVTATNLLGSATAAPSNAIAIP